MDKTKKQINEEWDELYQYIKHDIIGYSDKAIPKYMILRFRGLADGKFMANKKTKPMATYEYTDILMTFKINKIKIHNAMRSVEFKDERHMFNYIMVIIEGSINDVVDMLKRKAKSETKTENVEVASIVVEDKAEYKKKTKNKESKLLNDLW